MHSPAVVFLSEIMPLGGTSNFALNIGEGMRAAGHWTGVAAAIREPSEILGEIRQRGLPLIAPEPGLVLYEERIEHLYRECARYAPSVVVGALSSGSFDFLRYVPAGCLRIVMIQSDDQKVYETIHRYLNWIDLVAGVSKEICRKMETHMRDGRKVPVVHQPYGVPMPENSRPSRKEGPLRVLYLGRLIEEQKRVSLMARVIKATLAANPDLTWTIAGEGPQSETLKADLSKVQDRLQFLGAVPYDKVPEVIAAHDVYFLCSDFEGLPLSLLESMGAGLVPVVSDLPSGISEVVNERNGIRVPITDEQGYVNAVLKLAEDRDMLNSYSNEAKTAVRQSHSTAAMTRRWEEMLAQYAPAVAPVWDATCKATVPMEVAHRWDLQPWLRPVRRLVKQVSRRGTPQ
jgi:glycosyltransferase involved in cell wall biosynthesis